MIVDLLKGRASVRNFSDKKIDEDKLKSILEAGRLAPSGGNEQPWKFGVITDTDLIEKISEIAYNQTWIKSAHLLIVLCSTIISDEKQGRNIQKYRFPKYKDTISEMDKELYSFLNIEEHQTKIPGTQMVLQALEYGIYSTWISYFDVEKVSELLELPKLCVPSEIIAFGYPAGEVKPRAKKSVEEITFYNRYKGT
jgi:nitroreductase